MSFTALHSSSISLFLVFNQHYAFAPFLLSSVSLLFFLAPDFNAYCNYQLYVSYCANCLVYKVEQNQRNFILQNILQSTKENKK